MKKKRVLLATAYEPNDTTSLLRAWGPFTLLDDVEIVRKPKTDRVDWFRDWSHWYGIDVCFIHRPSDPSFIHLIHYAKLHGIPVWIDHDDDLIKITPDNPVFSHFQNCKEAVEYSYKEADILTCSGEVMVKELQEKYGRKDAILITSGLDDRHVRFKKPFNKNKKISWRGSKSHLTDLLFYQPAIEKLMTENPEHEWIFYGINPFFLDWKGEKKISSLEQVNLLPFLVAMTFQNCSIHMVPLLDTPFNHVKSNLAWLDATLAGSVVVGPDIEEWQRPGIAQYKINSQGDFYGTMQASINGDTEILEKSHNESWEFIRGNLMTSKLNEKRSEILRNL